MLVGAEGLQHNELLQPTLDVTAKTLLAISAVMLGAATVFGVLNSFRVTNLQNDLARTAAAKEAAEQERRLATEQAATGVATAGPKSQPADDANSARAEAELARVLQEKADLQTKLKASEAEVASLREQAQSTPSESVSINPGAPSSQELQAQLDDTRRQLEQAERENALLSEKMSGGTSAARLSVSGTSSLRRERARSLLEPEVKRHAPRPSQPGLRGTVMAVNHAYNFVVLNVGDRQGLRASQEMLVLRDGVMVGKLRISSVEPATAIGDIVTNSLARGVQVQTGDTVIYADNR